ncbi:peptidoglycan DD-metalloendopeptidase family protein [Carboxylicivirga sediminis]|uniref:Peptidoglycan DD-metalloendopeptidase family protein n=1 Tax=Carboxylicivirga sediminis TaxID=2006564 RepID=A0A941F6C5_9BACT|nr:peptidoglycan DD-metalloendopeptidase family protein [Carboxylicivirga sediminis]MBR8537279.1 peptidoglycan DD-metalloendopeptidase family protein [Carboxylicivirga sediminis]
MEIKRLFILSIFTLLFSIIQGQNLAELESQKERINQRIENANSLIKKYANQRSNSLKNIRLLNSQIKDREDLIELYNDQINLLENDIKVLNIEIEDNQKQLVALKDQYTKLIRETYSNKKRYNELSFFFGAESFNEAYRRYIMLKEYNKFRHNQGILIQQKSTQLDEANSLLNTKLKVQNNALNNIKTQYEQLVVDKRKIDSNIKSLQQKESSLRRKVRQDTNALKKLEDTILKLIAELNKEAVEPSDFHLAKGKLSWPISNGVIVSQFGEHQHPVLKYVKVKNNGVDIQSNTDSKAKVVFGGKVSRVVPIPGYNNAVLVRHGRFLTVYANLDNVSVKAGENVTKNSVIGTIYSGNGENSGVLHFEIWEESEKLNPEFWLLK